jgi:hypothetical protein
VALNNFFLSRLALPLDDMTTARRAASKSDTSAWAVRCVSRTSVEGALLPFKGPEIIGTAGQQSLFRWWERRRHEPSLPPVSALADESVVPLLTECIFYQVVGSGADVDFLATSHGADVHPLFGRHVVGTLISEHASPALLQGILASYRAVVESRQPVFTVRNARDDKGVAVRIEILRLPLSDNGGGVDAILSHFAILSPQGPFSRNLLMRSGSTEDYAVAAIIGRRAAGQTL